MSTDNLTARKTDRRVGRTRRMLREALFALILEQGYDAVTVEEITRRADLGRTTFYLHYKDKEDLLLGSIGEVVEDLIAQLAHQPLSGWLSESEDPEARPSPAVLLPFQHVAQNADLYRVILRGEGTYSVSRQLRAIIVQAAGEMIRVLQEREQLRGLNPQVPMEIFQNFIAGSWQGLVAWWLENNLPYSAEQMAMMYQKLILRGAREVLGG